MSAILTRTNDGVKLKNGCQMLNKSSHLKDFKGWETKWELQSMRYDWRARVKIGVSPNIFFFPTSLWGFCFLACIPPVARPVRRVRVPSANNNYTDLTPLISQLLISHNSSHNYSSHTTHLTHNSSHTTHLTHTTHLNLTTTHLTHNSSHTQLISHNSSHTQLISTHLTQLISHNSSHTQLISHTTHLTHLISQTCCLAGAVLRASWRSCGADCRRLGRGSPLRGRRSTQRLLKELGRGLSPAGPRLLCAWQAQYSEPPEAAAARIVAGWAAALLCVAGAVHRGFWRSCGADCRRLGRGSPSAVILAFAEEVSLWQICVAAVILAFAEEVSLRQICVAAFILAFAEEVSLWQICVAAVILAFAEEVSVWAICAAADISHTTHPTPLISHDSSHTTYLTQLISHPSSHATHLTPLISHNSSHTTHPTPLISHPSSHTTNSHRSSHTTHLTPLISHNSSHTPHLKQLISHH